VEPSPFTPLLSLTADFQQKWQPKMLISPGTNPLQTHFVIWLYEWVHICHLTASAWVRCLLVGQHFMGVRCPIGPYLATVKGYPAKPRTIGEAIRKRRLDLGLRQIDVARIIGCNQLTIINWEKGHMQPQTNKIARIERFLTTVG
jgi:DNA-binding XRE family transcriptional regulator